MAWVADSFNANLITDTANEIQKMTLNETGTGEGIRSQIVLPDEGVSLVFKDTDLLDLAVGSKDLLESLFGRSLGQVAAIDGAIGGRRLAKDFVIGQRLGTG